MASKSISRRILYKRIHITRKQRQALTALVPNNKKTRVHLSRINITFVLEFADGDSHHIKLLRDPCGNVFHIGRLLLLILSTSLIYIVRSQPRPQYFIHNLHIHQHPLHPTINSILRFRPTDNNPKINVQPLPKTRILAKHNLMDITSNLYLRQ